MATSGSRKVLTVSARELKYRTGAALRAVSRHDRVVVTRRGRPFAALMHIDDAPLPEPDQLAELRSTLIRRAEAHPLPITFDEYNAWLRSGRVAHSSTRGRSSSISPGRRTPGRR